MQSTAPGPALGRRRNVAALLAIAIGTSLIGLPASADAAAAPSGKLTVWVGSWWQPNVAGLTAAFEKAYPDIQLDIQTQPIAGYPDKFTASALGGDPPDIVDLDIGMISTIASRHLLQPMDDLIKQENIDAKAYASAVWQASSFGGVQYGVPDHAYSSFMYYNKTLFQQAHVQFPTSDWTYDDFVNDAKKLTGNGVYGFGMAADNSDAANVMDFIGACIWAKGGDFFNADDTASTINSPQSIAGLKLFADLYTTYKVTPPGTPNFTTTRDIIPLFAAGKVAMMSQGATAFTVLVNYPKLDYGMVTMPDKVNRGGGWTMAIPVGASNPDAAKVFIKWYADPKNQGTYQPTTPGLIAANKMPPWNKPQFDVSTAAFKDSRSLPQLANWTPMQTDIITEMQKVLVGQETVEQAANTLQSDLTSKLN